MCSCHCNLKIQFLVSEPSPCLQVSVCEHFILQARAPRICVRTFHPTSSYCKHRYANTQASSYSLVHHLGNFTFPGHLPLALLSRFWKDPQLPALGSDDQVHPGAGVMLCDLSFRIRFSRFQGLACRLDVAEKDAAEAKFELEKSRNRCE